MLIINIAIYLEKSFDKSLNRSRTYYIPTMSICVYIVAEMKCKIWVYSVLFDFFGPKIGARKSFLVFVGLLYNFLFNFERIYHT